MVYNSEHSGKPISGVKLFFNNFKENIKCKSFIILQLLSAQIESLNVYFSGCNDSVEAL